MGTAAKDILAPSTPPAYGLNHLREATADNQANPRNPIPIRYKVSQFGVVRHLADGAAVSEIEAKIFVWGLRANDDRCARSGGALLTKRNLSTSKSPTPFLAQGL
ncbi:MAG TPA: hypothetical protein VKV79_03460 [Terriglobia bacterium]|nr:hypothetical protein [Terriglobia bacterium]